MTGESGGGLDGRGCTNPAGRRPRPRPAVRVAALLALALYGCEASPVERCTERLEAGDFEAAAATCGRAFEETGDAGAGAGAARAEQALGRGERVLDWARRLAGTAEEAGALYMAAGVHGRRGDQALAEDAYRRALEGAREAGDHALAARSLYGLFYLAWNASRFHEALAFADQAARESAAAGDRSMAALVARGRVMLHYDLGDLDGAERALAEAEALVEPEQRAAGARLALFEGLLRLDRGRPALARAALERALELATGDEERAFFRSVHLDLVRAHLDLGDPALAERHLAAAWEHADADGGNRTALHYFQARLEHLRGRPDAALEALRSAASGDPVPDWKWELEVLRGRVEEARGAPRAAEAAYASAAEIVERLRRSLESDELKAWLLDRKREPFEALFRLQAAEGRLSDAVATLERSKARSFLDAFIRSADSDPGPAASAGAADRVAALRELLPAVGSSPAIEPRPIGEVLERLGGRHVLLYFAAGDRLWLTTVADRRVSVHPLALSSGEVERRVSRFLARIDDPATAAELGAVLLPEDTLPSSGGRLHVVADGALGGLPFAALRRGGRYLVEDHAISYVPGLQALAALEDRGRGPGGPAVVLGDPAGDLPAAALEAREVAARLGAPVRLGSDATLARLAEASRARVLHLAVHAGLDPRGAWLALADGRLDAGAVVRRRLAPRLAVLASCAGAARRGRGMWGSLAAAFLAAGSEQVLAALWSIEDETGRRFVLRFYDEGGVDDPAAALARTQRAWIAAGEPPSSWAPFVLFGSGGSEERGGAL